MSDALKAMGLALERPPRFWTRDAFLFAGGLSKSERAEILQAMRRAVPLPFEGTIDNLADAYHAAIFAAEDAAREAPPEGLDSAAAVILAGQDAEAALRSAAEFWLLSRERQEQAAA